MIGTGKISGRPGLALVEILVALALFTVAAVIALAQFDAARRTLALGETSAELQQALRVGFDDVARGTRSAGLAVDPDGNPLRPDEAVEGAFSGALVIRADFDGRTADAADPEAALAHGGPFANVTTGNDEIRAYVLAKPDGSSTDTLEFVADVEGVPRDGVVESVAVARVALDQNEPPYTLYRLAVNPDSTRTVRTPVIENVRSLRFTYFDAAGNLIHPPGGAEDQAARRARSSIRRVRIELEGLAAEPDPRWVDPQDSNPATRRYRKFRLSGDVTPRNLALPGRTLSPA